MSKLEVDVPEAFEPLLRSARYKGAHGGRGGGKSHFFAEQIILRCYAAKTRVACIREVQTTIKDSVKQLLVDKISKLGLQSSFQVLETEIRGPRGSLIVFRGMQSYNAENIKSLEDFDLAWIEEAQSLSERSLRLLRPTIRKDGSEIWASWNPRHDTDAIDNFLRTRPPADSIVVSVGWEDNPWFNDVLRAEKDEDYAADPEMAEHVWGGGYEILTEAAYYARLIIAAEKAGRVGHFPYNPALPVVTGWDLGIDDYTAIWFAQIIQGQRLRIIDYYESQNLGVDEIFAEALPEYTVDDMLRAAAMQEIPRDRPFSYAGHFYPHDIGLREWGAGGRTRVESVMKLGVPQRLIHRGVAVNPQERVEAVRKLLPVTEFNQSKRVMQGLTRLRRYQRKRNELMGTYVGPLKDGNDHGADAFGELAINCGIHIESPPPKEAEQPKPGQVYIPGAPEASDGKRTRI